MHASRFARPLAAALSLTFVAALAGCATAPSGAPRPTTPAPPPAVPAAGPWQHEWARGAVFYEVFVRSFDDANGDGKGDLRGLIAKLDYLNDGDPKTNADLGVDALWLMPVFRSPSYHGYDTTDYEQINPDYGTNEDFARLCQEAHRRGVKIVVDLVLNHTSDQHPWFVDSASSPKSAHRNWYVWRPDDPGWKQPWGSNPTWHAKNGAYYYGLFWGGMPDLNYRTAAVRAEARRIAKLWLDRGVDGFRLDAARHMIEGPNGEQADTPETHAFWKEFAAYVRSVRPDAVLIGENWTDTAIIATYYGDGTKVRGGDELPMNFDFPIAGEIMGAEKSGSAAGLAAKIEEVRKAYPEGAIDAPFLTNHDMARVATQLGDDAGKLRSAAAILLTLPGAPFVYYGEELGMQNGPGRDDEFKRTPMPWDGSDKGGFTTGTPWFRFAPGHETENVAAAQKDENSLLRRYVALIRARHASPALMKGDITIVRQDMPEDVLAFTRAAGRDRVLVLHNVSARPAYVDLPGTPGAPLFVDANVTTLGPAKLELPAYGTAIYKLP